MLRRLVLVLALACLAPCPALAQTAADLTRQSLESGRFESGETALAARLAADPKDNEARFGLGMVLFAEALEHFGQRQYRFGVRAPSNPFVPILRMPVPVNPRPRH